MKVDWKNWGIGLIAAIIILAIVLMFLQTSQNTEFKVKLYPLNKANAFKGYDFGTITVPVSIPLSNRDACTVAIAAFKLNTSNPEFTCTEITHQSDGMIRVSNFTTGTEAVAVAKINETSKTVFLGYNYALS